MNVLQEIPFYITYLSFTATVFALILIIRYEGKKEISNYFTCYLGLSLTVGIVSLIMAKNRINNLPLLHIYTLLEFMMLSLFYRTILKRVSFVQKYFGLVFWGGIIVIVLNSLFLQNLTEFNSNAKTFSHITLLGLTLLFFMDRMQINNLEELDGGLNMINSGILFYLSGSLFIFMTSNILIEDNSQVHEILWIINAMLYLIFQIIILIGVWKVLYPRTNY